MICIQAYKNFGNRVANFSKKLSERRKYLLHPAKQRSKSSSETTRIQDKPSSSSLKASKTEKIFLGQVQSFSEFLFIMDLFFNF